MMRGSVAFHERRKTSGTTTARSMMSTATAIMRSIILGIPFDADTGIWNSPSINSSWSN
jgi:hypothetical protein